MNAKFPHRLLQRLLTTLVIYSLLFSATAPALNAQSAGPIYLPVIANGADSTPTNLIFRTRVTVNTQAQWQDLTRLGVVILAQGADWALVVADDEQLADLARLRFTPMDTNALETLANANAGFTSSLQPLLAQAATAKRQIDALTTAAAQTAATRQDQLTSIHVALRTALQALDQQQRATLLAAASVDSDNDGLTDDQEGFWCTDAHNADSDGDHVSDGAEVKALKAWMNNETAGPPSSGKPFRGWPPQISNCFDDDRDSVPDLAEVNELGLNPNRESTDGDKFDDGEELFGSTNCPGGDTNCGYGDLPRSSDSGYVGSTMPSWVKAPGNHPLVAAFPKPEIDVVESSFHVQPVTTVTTDHTISSGTEKSYSTAKTEGTSTSNSDMVTWNEWQEVSLSTPINVIAATSDATMSPTHTSSPSFIGLDDAAAIAGIAALGFAACAEVPNFVGDKNATCGGGARWVVNKIGEGVQWTWNGIKSIISPQQQCSGGSGTNNDSCQTKSGMNLYQAPMCTNPQPLMCTAGSSVSIPSAQDTVHIQSVETGSQSHASGGSGSQIEQTNNQAIVIRPQYEINTPIYQPVPIATSTKGKSQGGAHTTTTTQYEEHTVTNSEAFSSGQSWGNATAVDSIHTADLWFTYKVRNTGTEYAREIANLAFNLYIGDDPNPVYTYFVAPDLGGDGKFHNFMPTEEHIYTSRHIPLTLNQMKAIDLGGPLRIVVEDFTYGADELFYQGAANAGVQVAIEDGTDDGDENLDKYLIPTWGQENVLTVLARYFPYNTDTSGTITAIWTPEYRSDTPAWCQSPRRPTDQPSKVVWCKHTLSTADWWNVYINGLGNGSDGFQNTLAAPGSVALFRFNKDSDLDGFSDRSEKELGTDPNDAASFPHPELLAGVNNIRSGNKVTSTLSLLNTGLYDAYGIEAVMIAPNDSISITNNTVGGSGRVRALKQVIVGSSIKLPTPLPSPWTQAGHAQPGVGGYYTGQQDRTYTLTVQCSNAGGCTVGNSAWTMRWTDNAGASGSLNLGSGYASPTFLAVGNLGVTVALYTGNVANGDSFTVAARTPRDTFQYTINREPHTDPLVVVSYNDPQGNHRFVLPSQTMSMTLPTTDLHQFAGAMVQNVGVELVTNAAFTPGVNSVNLLVNNPSDKTLTNARLFLEALNISGTVVAEISSQVTLPPGSKTIRVSFNSNAFNPTYDPKQDYIVMAFVTDYQGDILDTAGRPLSSFQVDPRPKLTTDDAALTWNFGTVAQGTLLKRPLALANTGFGRLYTYIPPATGLALAAAGSTVGAADVSPYALTLRTADLPVGAYDKTITIATSDPLTPTRALRVYGTITAPTGDTSGGPVQRPLDVTLTVTGTHSAGEWINFTHTLGPDSQSLHPVKVYSPDYGTLLGVGKYATNFGQGTASADMFGDGRDGVMPGSGNLDNANGAAAGIVTSGSAGSTSLTVADAYNVTRINPGDVVLIHQTQGTNAGCWEMNKAVSDFVGGTATYQLAKPLKCNYNTSGNNHAQILRVPQYSTCNVTGTVTPLAGWNGNWGGIFAVLCNATMTISGQIDAGSYGFRGGSGGTKSNERVLGWNGESYSGPSWQADNTQWNSRTPANGGGGGGGHGQNGGGQGGGGGGGSYGSSGQPYVPNQGSLTGSPGDLYGTTDLSQLHLGSGGGGGGAAPGNPGAQGGAGGSGGGAIVIYAKQVNATGSINANGQNGGNAIHIPAYEEGGGGGGSGGSIRIVGSQVVINSASLTGGSIGHPSQNGDSYQEWGEYGGNGRMRIEFCESNSSNTNPVASTQKLNCYIAEQIETAPYTSARLNLPAAVNGSATYKVQFGRKLDFAAAGNQLTSLRMPAGMVSSAKFDLLASGTSVSNTVNIDVGDDGIIEWSGAVANNSATTSPELAQAFNAYWASHGASATNSLDVPVRVTSGGAAQFLLTNLQVQSAASSVRYLRLSAQTYAKFLLDFTAGASGSVVAALDVGNKGSIDWSAPSAGVAPMRWKTGDLKAALNAYLAGKSGEQLVPIRFYVSPAGAVTLNDYEATVAATTDLVASSITVSGNPRKAGDSVTVQAVLRNAGTVASGPVTAAFFANATGWGDWYLGSTFFANIPAGGSVSANTLWNTTGFSGTVPVKVVINPYCRVAEPDCKNNSATLNVTVPPPAKTGDVDGDGSINVLDLQRLIKMILNATKPDSTLYPTDYWQRADLNQDQAWNVLDLQKLINLILAQ